MTRVEAYLTKYSKEAVDRMKRIYPSNFEAMHNNIKQEIHTLRKKKEFLEICIKELNIEMNRDIAQDVREAIVLRCKKYFSNFKMVSVELKQRNDDLDILEKVKLLNYNRARLYYQKMLKTTRINWVYRPA